MIIKIDYIAHDDTKRLWELAFKEVDPIWSHYNAPYFNEYQAIDYKTYLNDYAPYYIDVDHRRGIYVDGVLVGMVSFYWESRPTRWLEFGLVIYDESYWGKGIGTYVSSLWITELFKKFPLIERVGFTTWSGNPGMMAIGDKLEMALEARLRKCRYYKGEYYDSIKYGILREEWTKKAADGLD
ncbi:MAG: GNAT family N-acetyltransferase [Erysipelothrix sp.]